MLWVDGLPFNGESSTQFFLKNSVNCLNSSAMREASIIGTMFSIKLSTFPLLALLASLLLTSCGGGSTQAVSTSLSTTQTAAIGTVMPAPAATVTPQPTATITATPEPLALRLGDQTVSLAEFQTSLNQLQQADTTLSKTVKAEDQRKAVIDPLSASLILAQAAFSGGFKLDDNALQAKISAMASQMGGEAALQDWLTHWGYSDASFHQSLRREAAAAWERDQIAAGVPEQAEQIHARQVMVSDADTADRILKRLQTPDVKFDDYAFSYDPQTGGDLGWFPRGYLLEPAVEEAAFALQPGQMSAVIKSGVGYHILHIIDRQQRALSPEVRRALQHKAIDAWLKDQLQKSPVEILVP